jgi:TetR/AcrR family transcriptional repressor of uid operon
MAKSGARVKQQRAHETREAILNAAGVVFSTMNYSEANLRDVSDSAGVTQGGLYFHFESKNALGVELIKRQHEISLAAGTEILKEDLGGVEGMVLSSQALAKQIMSSPIVRAGMRLSSESRNSFPEYANVPYEDWIKTSRLFLEKGVREGVVKPSTDITRLANFMLETFTGIQFVSQVITQWKDFPDRLAYMWETVLPSFVVPEKLDELQKFAREFDKNVSNL